MNKHILLVMKWLNDNDSVTQKELDDNRAAADAAYAAAYAAADAADAYAEEWVNKYFERTKENKQDYIDALNMNIKPVLNNHYDAAKETLVKLGYTYTDGAELWKPPLGKKPDCLNEPAVYTQAMVDAGVMPSVGMECLVKGSIDDDYHYCEILMHRRIDNSFDVAMFVIEGYDDKPYYYSHCGADYFKPLTPPIELIDGFAYQFDCDDKERAGIYVDGPFPVFIINNDRLNPAYCTNIQLLEVK